jgi:hypothetical protein
MTHETGGASGSPKRGFLQCHGCAAAALAIAIVTGGPVHADVRVNGDVTAVRVEATTSNVADVLSALESAFHLRVKTSVVLDSSVGGTFTGSLTHVVSRLLEDYNYFIRRQAGEIEVTVVGSKGDRAIAVEQPRMPAGYGLALQSRALPNNSPPQRTNNSAPQRTNNSAPQRTKNSAP